MTTQEIIDRTVNARKEAACLTTERKREALLSMARALRDNTEYILSENAADVEKAREYISEVMIDRLSLNKERIEGMAGGIEAVTKLPDPTGRILASRKLDNGLEVNRVSVPVGVVAMIYESRPNVTSDAASLSIMSGNCCVLRGGKEAIRTNLAVAGALKAGLVKAGLDPDMIGMVEDTERKSSTELMEAVGKIDILIPRGGAGLIRACVENSKVPCIQTGSGICHGFVDESADIEKALNIIENAKTSRPSVCNAMECTLVHEKIAPVFLPALRKRLVDDRKAAGLVPVEMRICEKAAQIIPGVPASEQDFDTEHLDYILSVKVVKDVKEAIDHIDQHSTGHSEAIITEDPESAALFTTLVDSSSVYVNASTRFTDGGEFGLGCEIGISTQKLHARGPMGLEALTSYKYVINGNGQIR